MTLQATIAITDKKTTVALQQGVPLLVIATELRRLADAMIVEAGDYTGGPRFIEIDDGTPR